MKRSESSQTDVVIVGAGPAGLATAIAARNAGFAVVLADHAVPPIDKACGEGIMPDGLAALAALGVEVPAQDAYAFRGIRFLDTDISVDATFPRGCGLGVRRTILHELLTTHAANIGVDLRWGTRISEITADSLTLNGEPMHFRWLVGADGHGSKVRQRIGIGKVQEERRRYGFRQHFAIQPWTDYVEVYWSPQGQAYVTPVAEGEVCVALITDDPHLRTENIPTVFPELQRHLAGAVASSRPQGAITSTRRLDAVVSGRCALVGEASGSVDAITGEGMSLGFQQAAALVAAMQRGSLQGYEQAHRAISVNARRMAKLMLLLGGQRTLRTRALKALANRPDLFAQMLRVHIGEARIQDFGVQRAAALGWQMLTA